ncbi:MAG: DDE-type integrase/transposase/recombinase [Paludibacter sp.]|nr:DDE-type integrase/transposase/recombinase [Paludibacter sp.]
MIEKLDINRQEQVWVWDITYIGSRNNHLYLSLITDAYSKKIMEYDLSLAVESSVKALKMALRLRAYRSYSLIHHSDRGLQYCSNEYQLLLTQNHVLPSMTDNYDPHANAVAEGINGILKDEFMIEKFDLNFRGMQHLVKDSIDKYNRIGPHSG